MKNLSPLPPRSRPDGCFVSLLGFCGRPDEDAAPAPAPTRTATETRARQLQHDPQPRFPAAYHDLDQPERTNGRPHQQLHLEQDHRHRHVQLLHHADERQDGLAPGHRDGDGSQHVRNPGHEDRPQRQDQHRLTWTRPRRPPAPPRPAPSPARTAASARSIPRPPSPAPATPRTRPSPARRAAPPRSTPRSRSPRARPSRTPR